MTADPSPVAALVLMLSALPEAQRTALLAALTLTRVSPGQVRAQWPTRRRRGDLPPDGYTRF